MNDLQLTFRGIFRVSRRTWRTRSPGLLILSTLLGCASISNREWPSNLRVTSQLFSLVESEFVDSPDFSKLRVGALRGLEKTLPTGSIVIEHSGDGLVLAYKASDGTLNQKTFSANPGKSEALQDVQTAFTQAKGIAPNIGEEALESSMLQGAIDSLDHESSFIDRLASRPYRGEVDTNTAGIGVELTVRSKILTVVMPIERSPAARAGIAAGDRIIEIQGTPTADLPLRQAITLLRGPLQSEIQLTVERPGFSNPMNFVLRREMVRVQAVRSRILDTGVGLIAIRHFASNTSVNVESAIKNLEKAGLSGLIIDLRLNTGGLLNESIALAGKFLPPGMLVTRIQGRSDRQSTPHIAKGDRESFKIPLTILVDRSTASGAEIVAAALQEAGRAVIVGSHTGGFSSIQTMFPLMGQSMLRLTTAKWLTSKGKSLEKTGLTPDILVEGSAAGDFMIPGDLKNDLPLQRALDVIRSLISKS